MKNIFEEYIIKTQFWVASMLVSLVLFFQLSLSQPVQNLFFLFCTITTSYNFIVFGKFWGISKKITINALIFIVSSLVLLYYCFTFLLELKIKFILLSCISALYSINYKLLKIRYYPFLKIIIVAIVWALTVSWFGLGLFSWELFFLLFFFILGLTILFDMKSDSEHEDIVTIVNYFGEQKAILISILSVLVSMLICYIYFNSIALYWTMGMSLGIPLIYFSSKKRNDFYFTFFIESISSFPLVVWVFSRMAFL